MPVLSNLASYEELQGLMGDRTLEFPWPVKRLTITNDGELCDLKWKFKDSHDWATLRPHETVSMELSVTQVMLFSDGALYRIWGIG